VPERSCLGCGLVGAKEQLARFVLIEGLLTADTEQKLASRGAYICRDLKCLERALKKRAFIRALAKGGALKIPGVEELSVGIKNK
jgi:predicted RNA-binding protein YlxR (DUF448 family)